MRVVTKVIERDEQGNIINGRKDKSVNLFDRQRHLRKPYHRETEEDYSNAYDMMGRYDRDFYGRRKKSPEPKNVRDFYGRKKKEFK